MGTLPNPDISHVEDNPLCGDQIRMDLFVEDNRIKEVRFSGHGCTISQAAASMLTEEIEGKSLDEVKQLTKDDILDMIGIPLGPVRPQMRAISSQGPQSRCLRHQMLARRRRQITARTVLCPRCFYPFTCQKGNYARIL